MFSPSNLRSPLGRARGLGSAKEGLHHWWGQRLTALALIPLTVWFVASVIGLAGTGYEEFVVWLASPLNATIMVLFFAVSLHHAQLGMQVVLEDYVSDEKLKLVAVIANTFFCAAVGIASIYAIFKLSSGV